MARRIIVVGAGLAGSEAAWQAAVRGVRVTLYEMRPRRMTRAHRSGLFAELVCSNSLGARMPDRPTGLLLAELTRLHSLLIGVAAQTALPAGGALAVDREAFARAVTSRLAAHPNITIVREEMTRLPDADAVVIATGPLTSEAFAEIIVREITGDPWLAFYDAMAPIIERDSLDMAVCFRASRYERGERADGDYINCPLDAEEYGRFVDALRTAETIPLRDFEQEDQRFFEACLPVEVLAARGRDALRFGPMRPVGLVNPRTGKRPYAVVQLRQDNAADTLYNLVGFQTNLRWKEQARVFRLIPGLENAHFVRYGQMHRNTFIRAPRVLDGALECRGCPGIFFAGQVAGAEGYAGSVATGWLAGVNAARRAEGKTPLMLPPETMIGALCRYLATAEAERFQPMKANFGLLPPLEVRIRNRRERYRAMAERSRSLLEEWAGKGLVPGSGE